MMENDCWIKSSTAKNELKELFLEIDKALSESYQDSPNDPELTLDGSFKTLFHERSRRYLEYFNSLRAAKGLCRIKISLNHITRKEIQHGADIGLVAQISIPGEIDIKKAVLVQSKRLIPKDGTEFDLDCKYRELFNSESENEPQWKRMLNITCSSVYFLYNPYKIRVGEKNKTVGTRVISAQNVEGKANANVKTFSAKQSLDEGKIFSDWIVDNFICCTIGDTSKKTIDTAFGENSDFPVHSTFYFVIKEEEVSPKDIR